MVIKEFEILRYLCEKTGNLTQRLIAEETGLSLGYVNGILSEFQKKGWIDKYYQPTSDGYELMEPYRVNNAVILAAGMSTRFVPFSYEKPKGLTVVKGEVLIERQIRQLKEAGIREIVLVLGHMMEKFLYLIDKYGVKVVVNNEFKYKNTHSSVYFARDYLKNSYVCCADNYFPMSIFHAYEFHSLYSVVYMSGTWRGERGVTTDNKGLIVATQRPAVDQWVMNGYAYFDHNFSTKFKRILENMWDVPGSENLYWEQVWAEHVNELPLYAIKYTDGQVMEFDSVADLEKFDSEFIKYNDMTLTRNICSILNCVASDIHNICPIQKGYTNRSFRFSCKGREYIYRTPGTISDEWLDRRSEKKAREIAKYLGIDDSYIYEDESGWMISYFIKCTENFDFSNEKHISMLCDTLKKLYKKSYTCGKLWDYLYETRQLLNKIKILDEETYNVAVEKLHKVEKIDRLVKVDGWPIQMVHNDLYGDNLLVSDNKLYVIDWEYAGDTDIGYDLCKLFVKNNAEGETINKWLSFYYGRKPTEAEKRHVVGCAAVSFYYWYVWALYMVKREKDYSDLVLRYLTIADNYIKEFEQ